MKSKKGFVKFLDILYWGLMIITTCINIVSGLKNGNISFEGISFEQINLMFYLIMILIGMLLVLFSFIRAAFKYLPITLLYIGIKMAAKKFNKQRLDKIDLKKYEGYYRDMIKEFSPAVLNYIDNFEINKNTVVATLMSLQLKGNINKQLQRINEDISKLDENEKYIYNNISNLQNLNFNEFERIIIEDCKRYNLLNEKEIEKAKAKKKIILLVLCIIGSIVLFPMATIIQNDILSVILILIQFACILAIPIIRNSTIAYAIMNSINPYVRSKRAQEINEMLEGLKNYLQDYSNMKDKSAEELIIWENYLIYSVIFNQNTDLIEEYESIINNIN